MIAAAATAAATAAAAAVAAAPGCLELVYSKNFMLGNNFNG